MLVWGLGSADMWSSIPWLQAVSGVALWVSAIAAATAAAAGLISGVSANRASEMIKAQTEGRIAEMRVVTASLEKDAADLRLQLEKAKSDAIAFAITL